MKKWIVTFGIIVILLMVMVVTKPSEDQYIDWVVDKAGEQLAGDNPFIGAGIELIGPNIIRNHTTEKDYFIYKEYKTEMLGKKVKVIGIFHTFIPISKP